MLVSESVDQPVSQSVSQLVSKSVNQSVFKGQTFGRPSNQAEPP